MNRTFRFPTYHPSQDVIILPPHRYHGMRGMVRWTADSTMGEQVTVWVYALNQNILVPPHCLESYRRRHDSRRADGWNAPMGLRGML